MMCPYGIDTGPDDDVRKYSFHLSFKGEEVNEDMETLHSFFRDLDERMIDLAVENSSEWFKKKLSRAVIQEF